MKKVFDIQYTDRRIRCFLFGLKVFSCPNLSKRGRFSRLYSKRFDAKLSECTMRKILAFQFKEHGNAYSLNLDNPRSFNEKLNWLKLYYHRHNNPLVTMCSDKVGVREYIKSCVGEEYLVPCLGVYEDPDDIDFDALPEKFAAKVNWGSGQNILCTNKAELDIEECKQKLREWMLPQNNHYYSFFEWGYKDIKPRIIIEEFLEGIDGLCDYKFYCNNGEPRWMLLVQNRAMGDGMRKTYFDMNFRRLPYKRLSPTNDEIRQRPKDWDKMIEIARKLSAPFPHVRVDFFSDASGRLLVGELTFCDGAGLLPYYPAEWDFRLGEWLDISNVNDK